MIRLYDVVRLRGDHSAERVPAGTIGTVIHVIDQPSIAYVVEVADRQGRTRALLTVTPDQVDTVAETAPGLAANAESGGAADLRPTGRASRGSLQGGHAEKRACSGPVG